WRLYLYDSDENRVHYLDASQKYYNLALEGYRAEFRKEIAAYENKYGKMSKTEKVAAALNFTAEQLDYRLGWVTHQGQDMYSGGDIYTAYKTGYGVCFDYSNLFYILCRSAGISCVRVAGMVSCGAGDTLTGHQWNAVRLGGKYYYVDPANDDRGSSTGLNASSHFFSPQLRDLYYNSDIYLVY
ncbi:MAG: transglutaminase-like domain-containing protein, partial [Lachnospiraceae bacterium]|nr:transglutaminase-like domain-containing protein [Lachnospiraceae bacterium]